MKILVMMTLVVVTHISKGVVLFLKIKGNYNRFVVIAELVARYILQKSLIRPRRIIIIIIIRMLRRKRSYIDLHDFSGRKKQYC